MLDLICNYHFLLLGWAFVELIIWSNLFCQIWTCRWRLHSCSSRAHLWYFQQYLCSYSHLFDYLFILTEERAAFVRGELRARGFSTRDLPPPTRPLPASTSNSPQTTDLTGAGSRDLLLALGWLMCREELIARLMFACAHPLMADSMPFRAPQQPGTNALSSSATLERIALAFVRMFMFISSYCDYYLLNLRWLFELILNLRLLQELYRLRMDSQEFRNSLEEGTRQTAFLNRKLRYKLRRLESAQQAIVQNARRLASQSAGVVSIASGQQELGELSIDRKHLSPLELSLLEHPDRLKEVCVWLASPSERWGA